MARAGKKPRPEGELRIIGGQWRGRRLRFSPATGLRPTADRIRETLFNWLAPEINGACCLDLFAGSGALGLEALSRGAGHCDFVDVSAEAMRTIQSHLVALDAIDRASCHTTSAQDMLRAGTERYDIVFVDPPFGQALAGPACTLLDRQDRLSPGALVYLETGADESLPELPDAWVEHRDKRAGGVSYRLFRTAAG
jgi:16S rRNA (guanine966-N2)-methyltransferase